MEYKGYTMPDDLAYDENHFWVRVEGDEAVMGMDDFAQKLAGEVVYVQLPDDGKKLKKGKKFAKVESGKWLGKVIAPCDGVITAVNEALEETPGLINEDPYGKGWMYRFSVGDASQLGDLVTGEEAVKALLDSDIDKYAD